MKPQLIAIVAAVLVVGCATTQQPEPATAKAPDISIHDAAADGNIEAVKQHIAAGTDVNAKNILGGTPLHNAVRYGNKEIIELLIAEGADVKAAAKGAYEKMKDFFGGTPLHHAVQNVGYGQCKEIVELLIAKGANVNAKDEDGETPLDLAIKYK